MSNDLPAQMQAHIDSADNYYKQLPRVNLQEGGTTVVYRTTNKVSAPRVL